MGIATVAGLSRFGDRKESIWNTSPESRRTGPAFERICDRRRDDLAAERDGARRRTGAGRERICVAVRGEPAPLTLARDCPNSVVLAQGRLFYLNMSVTRRAGFTEAVVGRGHRPAAEHAGIARHHTQGGKVRAVSRFCRQEPRAGDLYVSFFRGTGAYPFNKDPKAKDKPNINLIEPSNPITVRDPPGAGEHDCRQQRGRAQAGWFASDRHQYRPPERMHRADLAVAGLGCRS